VANIRFVREKLGLKQGEVAKAVGIAQATYCNIENGKSAPSVDSAKKIGKVLGIDQLLFEDEVELTPDEERFLGDFRMASAEEQAAIRRRLIRSANGGNYDTRRNDSAGAE